MAEQESVVAFLNIYKAEKSRAEKDIESEGLLRMSEVDSGGSVTLVTAYGTLTTYLRIVSRQPQWLYDASSLVAPLRPPFLPPPPPIAPKCLCLTKNYRHSYEDDPGDIVYTVSDTKIKEPRTICAAYFDKLYPKADYGNSSRLVHGRKISLHIKLIDDGFGIFLVADSLWTVEDLKEAIRRDCGAEIEKQRLVFQGVTLDNSTLVQDCNFAHLSVVSMYGS